MADMTNEAFIKSIKGTSWMEYATIREFIDRLETADKREASLEKEKGITYEEQNRIRDFIIKRTGCDENRIDGGGCDSGDPMDFTIDEIAQGFACLEDEIEQKDKQIAGLTEALDLHKSGARMKELEAKLLAKNKQIAELEGDN